MMNSGRHPDFISHILRLTRHPKRHPRRHPSPARDLGFLALHISDMITVELPHAI